MHLILSYFSSLTSRIYEIISSDLLDSIDRLENCDVLFFCHDNNRPLNLSGKAYSPLIDSVRDDFEARGLSCQAIAYPWSSLTKNKAYGAPHSFNMTFLRCWLVNKLAVLFRQNKEAQKNPYIEILTKTKSKLVITVGLPKDLALAARESGVFLVELLHGIGYTSIEWGWNKRSKKYLPRGILSLDIISTSTFSLLIPKDVEIYTIPHPFLKRFTFTKFNSQPAEWKLRDGPSPHLKHILVSFNWAYAGDHQSYIEYANILDNGLFFDQIGELVKEESGIFWHFRFHPIHLRQRRYKNLLMFMDNFVLAHPNSDWREASRVPFPSIAMHCDGHISMSSMSCYDAAAMGVPSLMLCPHVQAGGIYQDRFRDLEKEGYVQKFEVDKERIRNWLHQTQKMEPRLSNLDDDSAWESAVEWMLRKSALNESIEDWTSM